MKLVLGLTVIILLVVVNIVTSENSDEFEKILTENADACKKEVAGSTDKDVKEMMEGAIPTTKVAKCLNSCLLTKIGIIKDGKLVADQLSKIICDQVAELKRSDGKTMKDVVGEIIEECKTVSDADPCETASKILICLDAGAKKRGLDKGIF